MNAPRASAVTIANRQRSKTIAVRHLKQVATAILAHLHIEDAQLGIHLVSAREMARVNWQFLQHEGPTDVITFDHGDATPEPSLRAPGLYGELFICVDVAILQAAQFKTSWQSELIRYIVHGILHLRGYDDLTTVGRRRMKRQENRLVRLTEKQMPLRQVEAKPRPASGGPRRVFTRRTPPRR
jgi:probable rRNA maturation factor